MGLGHYWKCYSDDEEGYPETYEKRTTRELEEVKASLKALQKTNSSKKAKKDKEEKNIDVPVQVEFKIDEQIITSKVKKITTKVNNAGKVKSKNGYKITKRLEIVMDLELEVKGKNEDVIVECD